MLRWHDRFTDQTFRISEANESAVRAHLARLLARRLDRAGTDLQDAADAAAGFWSRDYYGLIFPVRFGLRWAGGDWLEGAQLHVQPPDGCVWRERPFDGQRFPPILPVADGEGTLLADSLVARAAVANVLLREAGLAGDSLHAARLALLLAPLWEELSATGAPLPQSVTSLVRWLSGDAACPVPGDVVVRVLRALASDEPAIEDLQEQVYLVAGGVQRVKQYVFESAGLNEIRGASTLLDRVTDQLREEISVELGPEVVFRSAGATIEFLAPASTDSKGVPWKDRIINRFRSATGTALITADTHPVPAGALWTGYRGHVAALRRAVEQQRETTSPDAGETLPFEVRCSLCQCRAAEGWDEADGRLLPICRVCVTKRKAGQIERRGKLERLLRWLDLETPRRLGVGGGEPSEYVARVFSGEGEQMRRDEGLIPPGVRRPLLGVVYGDGNNFGSVVQRLESLPQSLQWTHRVEQVTQAAAALAMGIGSQQAARMRGWSPGAEPELQRLPFQVLALGGDDLSVFAWGPAAVHFAREFTRWTDVEFEPGEHVKDKSRMLSFSVGLLISDVKAPVQRTVDFAEDSLLAWAKRAQRASPQATGKCGGKIAMVLALTAEQIPSNLDRDRCIRYLLASERQDLYLTIRPYTAGELGYLLDIVGQLKDEQLGRLQRLVSACVGQSPQAALLHAIYQWARERRRDRRGIGTLADIVLKSDRPDSLKQLDYPAARLDDRLPFGEPVSESRGTNGEAKSRWYSILGDLMELSKILR